MRKKESLFINFLDWIGRTTKQTYNNWGEYKYYRTKRWIKHYLYNLKIFVGIFKLPEVLRRYNYTLGHALLGLKIYKETIDERNNTIRYLLEKQVETKLGDTDYSKEQEREAYREAYLDGHIEYIYEDDMNVFELPQEYMTDKEHDDWFDRSYEHQREVSAHCYDSIEEQIDYEFDNGPLVKGGWYDKKNC